jgi:ABC-type glycerol-3-phosphate transport system permease component
MKALSYVGRNKTMSDKVGGFGRWRANGFAAALTLALALCGATAAQTPTQTQTAQTVLTAAALPSIAMIETVGAWPAGHQGRWIAPGTRGRRRVAARRAGAVAAPAWDSSASEVIVSELDKVRDRGKHVKLALADAERVPFWRTRGWSLDVAQACPTLKRLFCPMAAQAFARFESRCKNANFARLMGSAIATIPLVILFVPSSHQLISGLTAGAVK